LIEYQSGARGLVDVRWHSCVALDEFRIRGTEGEIDLTPLNDPALISPLGREQIPASATCTTLVSRSLFRLFRTIHR
jgi:hypothetical protein